MTKVLILGATGHIALHAARALTGQSGVELRLTSSRDEGVARLKAEFPGAEVVKADWMERDSLVPAFAGVNRAMMVTPDFTDERTAIPNVVVASKTSPGFDLLVRLTAIAEPLTEADMTEEWLSTNAGTAMHWIARSVFQGLDVPLTYVNIPSYTAFNLSWLSGEAIRTKRQLTMTGDAARLWIVEEDVGEVFARILRDGPAQHAGREYVLTGPERLRYGQIAEMLSDELGETVTWVESPEGYQRAVGDKAPVLSIYGKYSSKHSQKQVVTNTIQELLGRPPTTMRQYVAMHRDLYK